MIVDNVAVNFDRILRITLWTGDAPGRSTSTVGGTTEAVGFNETTPQTVVLEYAPLDNAAFCPNIEVTTVDIWNPGNKNNQPGFTAKVTITNPDNVTRRIIANHITYPIDYTKNNKAIKDVLASEDPEDAAEGNKAIIDYYNSRVKIRIEAGYWRSERANTAAGCRDYTTIFEGWVNSNAWYRKGIDDIAVLACHNLDLTGMTDNAIRKLYGLEEQIKLNAEAYIRLSYEEQAKRNGSDAVYWSIMAQKLVRNFSQTRPTKDSQIVPVQPWDRVKTDWYGIRFIYTPNDKETFNLPLEKRLNELVVNKFYTTAPNLYNMLSELCSYKGANVNFLIDDTYRPGRRMLFIYPLGSSAQFTKSGEAKIRIINYQNLLEAPAVEASGSLNVKMFFNPQCKPQLGLELVLTDEYGSDTSTGTSAVRKAQNLPTTSFQGDINPYIGLQQGSYHMGVHGLQIGAVNAEKLKKDALTRGYLFNTGFPIERVTHNLATRGNKWETIVKTIPAETGVASIKE